MASKQPTTEKDEMASAISNLAIDTPKATTPSQTKPKPKKKNVEPIADSWEDEDLSDEEPAQDKNDNQQEDAEEAASSSSTPSSSLTTPAVPPPTPASPLALDASYEWAALATTANQGQQSQGSSPGGGTPARRPEKTDAVARRMIAAGLGLKAPRQTEEQRAYQRSVREQEKKRREAQRAEEARLREAAERAKAAVWED
ncbi:hypothetical protein MKX07_008460 [Trichoderma sp. CBMAI-0711]|uniref:Uncharacterized protein n=1 Tax=Trichoderma parareesei TaxID=858221 RepID=A0A2H2ZAH6_TRIPA|nr:hypothetical protein MKX07_008460 [Trichoderma sp. CBMAI-0711]OTA04219.1 hypothetical protein A9Z42_0047850 [Trichoderma parareesei]